MLAFLQQKSPQPMMTRFLASFLQSPKSNIRINTNAAILFIVSQGGNTLSLHGSCVRVLKDSYTYQANSVFAYIYHNDDNHTLSC